ncbi:MAG: hypothetical protein Kow0089_07210 [Desulfobulbaceae bacterium]
MTTTEKTTETLTVKVPSEIADDLREIARFNETEVEKLLYSYIVEGIAGDARAAKRMRFTDRANEVLGKNNPPKTVEEIFNNLVF